MLNRRFLEGGQGLSLQPLEEPLQDDLQSVAAGVDHTCLPEHVELFGGALDRVCGSLAGAFDDLCEVARFCRSRPPRN